MPITYSFTLQALWAALGKVEVWDRFIETIYHVDGRPVSYRCRGIKIPLVWLAVSKP
jgi:hypothetical protein